MLPTVNRPVRLGVLPILEQVNRFCISWSDNYFLSFSCRAPSLMRGLVCNLQCNDLSLSLSLIYIVTDGQSTSSSWCWAPCGARDEILIFFVWQFLSSRCRAPSPIFPMNRIVQPKVKDQSYISEEQNLLMLTLGGLHGKHAVKKSKLYYDRQSVGQSVLVSDTPLGPATNFLPFLFNYF
jgi:hypothetical protein